MGPESFASRLRALDGRRLDLLLGLAVGVEMQLEALLIDASAGRRAAAHAAVLVLAVAVALRRRAPFASFLVANAAYVSVQACGAAVADHLVVGLFAVLFVNYSVAANASDRAFGFAPPLAFGAALLGALLDDYGTALSNDLFYGLLIFVGAPMITGRLVRNRARLQRALRDKAARLERERDAEAERAVLEERSRIAGELHDIVAHALSEMTVQATAAGRLAHRDPDAARQAFGAVETSGRDALAELRRLLGVLRRDDEELALAPQPSLRHLGALARRARSGGLPVDVHVEGTAIDLPPGLDVTSYRVVQEALGGARDDRRAGRATVLVRYADRAVELEVRDDGRAPGPGDEPLLGLRERVGLYGGDLDAAPLDGGGHVVRARLPLEVVT